MTTRFRIALAQLNPTMGDIPGNLRRAKEARAEAAKAGADLILFPELYIVGYPPEDLVLKPALQDDAREAVGASGHVTDEPDPVADDDALAAELAGAHRGDRTGPFAAGVPAGAADQAGVAAAIDRDDERADGVFVRRAPAGTRPGTPARTHTNVVLIEPRPVARHACRRVSDHSSPNSGSVLPTVGRFSTSTPGTARPSTAPAITMRWSS